MTLTVVAGGQLLFTFYQLSVRFSLSFGCVKKARQERIVSGNLKRLQLGSRTPKQSTTRPKAGIGISNGDRRESKGEVSRDLKDLER